MKLILIITVFILFTTVILLFFYLLKELFDSPSDMIKRYFDIKIKKGQAIKFVNKYNQLLNQFEKEYPQYKEIITKEKASEELEKDFIEFLKKKDLEY